MDPKPPRFTNVVVGGGVTPFIGFRIGASVTHGGWMSAGESPTNTVERDATVYTVESELSFAYTKLAGEWVRDQSTRAQRRRWRRDGSCKTADARSAMVCRRTSRANRLAVRDTDQCTIQRLTNFEEVLGYRLTPESPCGQATARAEGFGRPGFDQQFQMSLVWWKRWI